MMTTSSFSLVLSLLIVSTISHLYLPILIFHSNSKLIDASDTKHTQTFLCFVGNLTPHAMEFLAQVRTAALLGHPQIGSLVIWSLGLTGGWREFGFDCWNEMLFDCHLWTLQQELWLCRCPQPLTWLKLSPLTQYTVSAALFVYGCLSMNC